MEEFELRNWQKNCMDFFFDPAHNGKMICNVPTGAGKTFIAIQIIKKLLEKDPSLKFLIIAPKLVIINKTWVPELTANGLHLNRVGIYDGDFKEYSKITITSTSSVGKMNYGIFDVLIADEVHNFGTPKLLGILERPFKYKIGLSATVTRSDHKHWEIFRIFDYHIFNYTMKEALADKVLNSFNFYDVVIDLERNDRILYDDLTNSLGAIFRKIGSYHRFLQLPNDNVDKQIAMKLLNKRKQLIFNYPEKMRIVCELAKQYLKENKKIIIFSQYNAMTNGLFYYFSSEGIKPCFVHSNITKKERDDALDDFKNGKNNIMLATKILDEGYNLPSIDVGILLASDKSERQAIQRLGRVLRKKSHASLLFQLYIRNTFESEASIERSKFFQELSTEYQKVEVK